MNDALATEVKINNTYNIHATHSLLIGWTNVFNISSHHAEGHPKYY